MTTRFYLESPYDADVHALWPEISSVDQNTLLELLCTFLHPIGLHRQNHLIPSRGKRFKKNRKSIPPDAAAAAAAASSSPEISFLVGFNSITRHLQSLSSEGDSCDGEKVDKGTDKGSLSYISTIFTTYPSSPAQSSLLHSHFPLLVQAASLSHPNRPPIRLVRLPKACESRLAATLKIPRVNFIALLDDTKGASALVELVRKKVAVVDGMMGLRRGDAIYRPPNIVGVKGKVGMGRKKRIAKLVLSKQRANEQGVDE